MVVLLLITVSLTCSQYTLILLFILFLQDAIVNVKLVTYRVAILLLLLVQIGLALLGKVVRVILRYVVHRVHIPIRAWLSIVILGLVC
jgi:hypothetical protein